MLTLLQQQTQLCQNLEVFTHCQDNESHPDITVEEEFPRHDSSTSSESFDHQPIKRRNSSTFSWRNREKMEGKVCSNLFQNG